MKGRVRLVVLLLVMVGLPLAALTALAAWLVQDQGRLLAQRRTEFLEERLRDLRVGISVAQNTPVHIGQRPVHQATRSNRANF